MGVVGLRRDLLRRSAYPGVHPSGYVVGIRLTGRSLPKRRAAIVEGWGLRAPALLVCNNPRTSRPGGEANYVKLISRLSQQDTAEIRIFQRKFAGDENFLQLFDKIIWRIKIIFIPLHQQTFNTF